MKANLVRPPSHMIVSSKDCQSGSLFWAVQVTNTSATSLERHQKDISEQKGFAVVNCRQLQISENSSSTLIVHPHSHESLDLHRDYTDRAGNSTVLTQHNSDFTLGEDLVVL